MNIKKIKRINDKSLTTIREIAIRLYKIYKYMFVRFKSAITQYNAIIAIIIQKPITIWIFYMFFI